MEQLIYKHSDFKLRETLPADMAGVPFSFDYFVVKNGKRYTASYDGAQYVNCANDNGVIVVCFDNPCFECGKLKAERRFTLQDDHFSDKSYNPVGLYELGIKITNDPTHIPGGDVSTEIAPSWAVGPAGPQGLPGKDGKDGAPGAPGATGADGAPGKIQRLVVNGQVVEADEAGTATFNVESTGGSGMTTEQATLLGTAEQLETTAKTLPGAVNELKAENAQLGRELVQIDSEINTKNIFSVTQSESNKVNYVSVPVGFYKLSVAKSVYSELALTTSVYLKNGNNTVFSYVFAMEGDLYVNIQTACTIVQLQCNQPIVFNLIRLPDSYVGDTVATAMQSDVLKSNLYSIDNTIKIGFDYPLLHPDSAPNAAGQHHFAFRAIPGRLYTILSSKVGITRNKAYAIDYTGKKLEGTSYINNTSSQISIGNYVGYTFFTASWDINTVCYIALEYFANQIDFANLVVYEGSPSEFTGDVSNYRYGITGIINNREIVCGNNLHPSILNTIYKDDSGIVFNSDLKTVTNAANTTYILDGVGIGKPLSAIGFAKCLLNTSDQYNYKRIDITPTYSHEATMQVIGNKGYLAYNFGTSDENPITTQKLQIEMSVIDLDTMEILGRYIGAKYQTQCADGSLLASSAGLPNSAVINGNIRITFTAKDTDGQAAIFYQDFNVGDNTFTAPTRCTISYNDESLPYNSASLSAISGKTVPATSFISMNCSTGYFNGTYYLGVGVDTVFKNAMLVKSSDFANFDFWKFDDEDDASFTLQYECALGVSKEAGNTVTVLNVASRCYSSDSRVKVTRYNLATGAKYGKTIYLQGDNSRPLWYYDGANNYLIMSQNARERTDVVLFNSLSCVCQLDSWEYPAICTYNNKQIFAGTYKHRYIRLSELDMFKYTTNNAISVVNKLAELII